MQVDEKKIASYVERIEALEDSKKELEAEKKSIFAEAEMDKFNVAALKEVIKFRKNPHAARELQDVVDVYKVALKMD